MSGDREATIKLYCPSSSMAVQWVAQDEQRLDLGSMARAFGLDPQTMKLNGHFISRGLDLIASSVTWRSLLSFFSARGLSTGTAGSVPLVVDGKLCKAGTKRPHDPAADFRAEIPCTSERGSCSVSTKPQLEVTNLLKRKRFMDSGFDENADLLAKFNSFGLKRKQFSEDISSLKRISVDKANIDFQRRETSLCRTTSDTGFPCSVISGNMKRMRDDEIFVPTPFKKIR